MRKLLASLILTLVSGWAVAEQTKTVFSPFTGKLDYITALSTSSVSAGAGIAVSTTSSGVTITASGASASSLQVTQSGVNITSPTSSLNFTGPPFTATAVGGTTAQITLNPSSVTLQGQNVIKLTSSLQSGATFFVSSGTVGSGGLIVTGGPFTISNDHQSFASFGAGTPSASLNYSGINWAGFGLNASNSGGTMLMTSALCVGLQYQGFTSNTGNCGADDLWILPIADSAGFWKSDGSHGLSIATLTSSDMSALLASTNVWTGGNTNTSSTTFRGNVAISSGVLLSGSAGSNGQVFTSGGAGTVPTWTTPTSGGSGSSSLAIATGSVSAFTVPGTSPTAVINFNSATFNAQLAGSATAFVSLVVSSVTLQGNGYSIANIATDTGTIKATLDNKVAYSSFSVSDPIRLSAAGAFSTTLLSATTGFTGTLQAAQFPALTGDITTSAGALATTATALQGNIKTFSSSITVTGVGGLTVTSGIVVATVTISSNTAFNGDVNVSSTMRLSGSFGTSGQVLTSGGQHAVPTWTTPASAGSSTLAIATGSVSAFTTPGSSPTAVVNFNSALFTSTLAGSATAYVSLVLSSVTALGSDIDLSGAEVSGVLKAAAFPALTGDITTSAGALATTAAALQSNIKTFSSSITVTGAGGLNVTYGSIIGTGTFYTTTVSTNALVVQSTTNLTSFRVDNTLPTAGDFMLSIATIPSNGSSTMVFGVNTYGHVISSGPVPAVSSCGTSPSIDGNATDFAGKINVGSVTATACTLTFASAFLNPPACVVSDDNTGITAAVTSITTTAAVFGFSISLAGGHVWYICVGTKG